MTNLKRSLISVHKICKSGGRVTFENDKFEVEYNGCVLMEGQIDETGLYAVNETIAEVNNIESLKIWHERFGH